ncbi:hypothetical protein GCM10020254_71140 [Streptomyces goshikiensis]
MGLLTAAAYASLAAWLWLTLAQGMFWRTDVRLPPSHRPPARWPSVAIVVPARDEAGVLARSLPSLLVQDYPGAAEVILVDDGSTDGTAGLALRLAAAHPGLPLTVVSPPATPHPAGPASSGPCGTASPTPATPAPPGPPPGPAPSSSSSPTPTSPTNPTASASSSPPRRPPASTSSRRWPGCAS